MKPLATLALTLLAWPLLIAYVGARTDDVAEMQTRPEAPLLPPALTEPQEDEPGWDCQSMGNRTCSANEPPPVDLVHDALARARAWATDPANIIPVEGTSR